MRLCVILLEFGFLSFLYVCCCSFLTLYLTYSFVSDLSVLVEYSIELVKQQ
ncbi:unnamed protein product [Brassica rapa subsp. narinosa]